MITITRPEASAHDLHMLRNDPFCYEGSNQILRRPDMSRAGRRREDEPPPSSILLPSSPEPPSLMDLWAAPGPDPLPVLRVLANELFWLEPDLVEAERLHLRLRLRFAPPVDLHPVDRRHHSRAVCPAGAVDEYGLVRRVGHHRQCLPHRRRVDLLPHIHGDLDVSHPRRLDRLPLPLTRAKVDHRSDAHRLL